jgi:Kelch motif
VFRLGAQLVLLTCMWAVTPPDAAADGQSAGILNAGSWSPIGGYPSTPRLGTVSPLPKGNFLVYGVDVLGERLGQLDILESLAKRDQLPHVANGDGQPPMVWLADKKAWQRQERPPQCIRDPFLHTATPLADGRVLIAGGLCDVPHLANEPFQHTAHTALSIWDPHSAKWQSAPPLRQAHIFHTSNRMPDGEVMVVGGYGDPLLGPEHAAPSKTVEKFADGVVSQMPDLSVARARHSATVMPDGSLMVIGGRGAEEQELASVELWDPGKGSWVALPPLLNARAGHVATLLPDGRVLVAAGLDAQGRGLQTTEIFSPVTGRWEEGPRLPIEMRSTAMTTTEKGEILLAGTSAIPSSRPQPRLYLWTMDAATWQVAGQVQHRSAALPLDHLQVPTLVQQGGGGVLVFGAIEIFRWTAQSTDLSRAAPRWTSQVVATALADGRVMVVGQVNGSALWQSHIWNPVARTWTGSGDLKASAALAPRIVQLGSGKVVLVAIDPFAIADCQWWSPDTQRWSACTSPQLQYGARGMPGTQTVDGHLFVVPNASEVLRFDENQLRWEAFALERSTLGLTYGAPIKMQNPLARFLEPQTQQWVDVSDAAAQNWQSGSASTVTTKHNISNGQPPVLLWDSEKTNWAYVFPDGQMSTRAAFLPDGCALSWLPFKLFNPATGRVKQLEIALEGLDTAQADLVVGKSGEVYLFGPGVGGSNGVAIERKADCNGFATHASDDSWMPKRWVTEIPVEAAAAAPLPTSASDQQKTRGYWAVIKEGIQSSQDILLKVAGALLVLELLRRTVARRVRRAASLTRSPSNTRTLKTLAQRNLPSSITWLLRIALWGVALIVAWPLLFGTIHMVQLDALQTCAAHPITCLSPKTALLPRVDSAPNSPTGENPALPCRYVGVWSSRQGAKMYRVSLFENGTYFMDMNPVYNRSTQPYRGYWAVQGSNMIWRHTVGNTGEPDVNPITLGERGSFSLREMNGSRTLYEPIAPLPKTMCQPS